MGTIKDLEEMDKQLTKDLGGEEARWEFDKYWLQDEPEAHEGDDDEDYFEVEDLEV